MRVTLLASGVVPGAGGSLASGYRGEAWSSRPESLAVSRVGPDDAADSDETESGNRQVPTPVTARLHELVRLSSARARVLVAGRSPLP